MSDIDACVDRATIIVVGIEFSRPTDMHADWSEMKIDSQVSHGCTSLICPSDVLLSRYGNLVDYDWIEVSSASGACIDIEGRLVEAGIQCSHPRVAAILTEEQR